MTNPTLKFSLLPKQHEFITSPYPISVYCGGVGAGKTVSAVTLIIKLALEHPGIDILVGAPTYGMLRDTIMDEFKKRCPPFLLDKMLEGSYPMALFHPNGGKVSKVRFRAFDDMLKPKGITCGALILDEATGIKEEILDECFRRVRQAGMPLYIRLMTNPDSKEHYFYKRFVEAWEQGQGNKHDVHYIHTTSFDNIKLPPVYLDQLRKLEKLRPAHYKRSVLGLWGDFSEDSIGAFPTVPKFSSMYRVAFIDTSYSDRLGTDRTAASIVSFVPIPGKESFFWPIEFTGKAWQKSVTDPNVIRELLLFLDVYKPIETCLESQLGDSTKVFIQTFKNAEKSLGLQVKNYWTWKHQTKNKHERIMLEVAGSKDRMHVLEGTDQAYLSQVMGYVKGVEHEDEIDSLASAIDLWKNSKILKEYIRLTERSKQIA